MHTVSGACSCCISKRGKRNTTGGHPSRREMMTLLLLTLAFLPQPRQSGSRSTGFPSATALVLFHGWWCVQTYTSPGSSRVQWYRSSHQHMETITLTAKWCPTARSSSSPSSGGRTGQVLGWLSRRRKSKHLKYPCAPKVCLELNHKMLI